MKQNINLVIVGHIDHGKSTLIGRLLYDSGAINKDKIKTVKSEVEELNKEEFEFAFIMDNLQEEREGGITIDTIQTPFESKKYVYTIIDCPGHKEFIKNMLTGASQADAAILLLSAKPDEKIQEQTKRHVFLVNMLGIKQIFVAINKLDLVNYSEDSYNELKNDMMNFLLDIGYDKSNITFIPISAKKGDNVFKKSENMPWYKGETLIEILDKNVKLLEPLNKKSLRLPIQDIYEINGKKILVGLVETGKLSIGDNVSFKPSNISGKVTSIEKWNEKLNVVEAGESIGFTIDADISNIKRGDVCSLSINKPKVVNKIKGEIFLLGTLDINTDDTGLIIRCGTGETKCKIEKIEKINSENGKSESIVEKLNVAEAGVVDILLENPLAIDKFSEIAQLGRFVIIKNNNVAASGIILE
ncbi:MAG: GTP-binding protein [Candidatus Aenigmarchaeota archaeon]|nr:GTP-binding protein [Candidatus Aenigmarchaeota archaeon]